MKFARKDWAKYATMMTPTSNIETDKVFVETAHRWACWLLTSFPITIEPLLEKIHQKKVSQEAKPEGMMILIAACKKNEELPRTP